MSKVVNQVSIDLWHKEVKRRAPLHRIQVLEAIQEIQPCCNQELARHLGWEINSVTGRVKELRDEGKVVKCYRQPYLYDRMVNYWATKAFRDREFPETF